MHELTKIARRIGNSDKATSHIYTEFYGPFLEPRRGSIKNVLEIGICDGGSMAMWHEFFPDAGIYGVDIRDKDTAFIKKLKQNPQIHMFFEDAYKKKFVNKLKGLKFDLIVEDGRHDLPAWEAFLKLYPSLLAKNGIMMIEDVFSVEHAEYLIGKFKGDKDRMSIIDRRTIPGAYRNDVTFTFEDGSTQTHFVTNEIVLLYM